MFESSIVICIRANYGVRHPHLRKSKCRNHRSNTADCLHAEIPQCTSYGHKLYENESERTQEEIEVSK